MTDLASKTCVACEGGTAPLSATEADVLLRQIPGWQLSDDAKTIAKTFAFADFAGALRFTDAVGALAEAEGHHPDIHLSWGSVRITLTTHAIQGLSENDFILASKIELL